MKHYRVTEDGIEARPGNLPKHKAEMPYPKYFETLQQARDFFYPGCDKPHPMPYAAPAPKITIDLGTDAALAIYARELANTPCRCSRCNWPLALFEQCACNAFTTACGPTQTPLPGLARPLYSREN